MTDEEWQLVLLDADALLRHLQGKVSDRKLRLLSAASGRAVWDWLDGRSRSGVIVLEKLADGLMSPDERLPAADAAQAAANEADLRWERAVTRDQVVEFGIRWWVANVVAEGHGDDAWRGALEALGSAGMAKDWVENPEHAAGPDHWAGMSMGEWEAALALEVFGNPFRPITVDSSWRSGAVVALAQAIYDDRAFDRMPILADALEEAGCDNADVLNHCRGPGRHVLGCWCLDLLLGKE